MQRRKRPDNDGVPDHDQPHGRNDGHRKIHGKRDGRPASPLRTGRDHVHGSKEAWDERIAPDPDKVLRETLHRVALEEVRILHDPLRGHFLEKLILLHAVERRVILHGGVLFSEGFVDVAAVVSRAGLRIVGGIKIPAAVGIHHDRIPGFPVIHERVRAEKKHRDQKEYRKTANGEPPPEKQHQRIDQHRDIRRHKHRAARHHVHAGKVHICQALFHRHIPPHGEIQQENDQQKKIVFKINVVKIDPGAQEGDTVKHRGKSAPAKQDAFGFIKQHTRRAQHQILQCNDHGEREADQTQNRQNQRYAERHNKKGGVPGRLDKVAGCAEVFGDAAVKLRVRPEINKDALHRVIEKRGKRRDRKPEDFPRVTLYKG